MNVHTTCRSSGAIDLSVIYHCTKYYIVKLTSKVKFEDEDTTDENWRSYGLRELRYELDSKPITLLRHDAPTGRGDHTIKLI